MVLLVGPGLVRAFLLGLGPRVWILSRVPPGPDLGPGLPGSDLQPADECMAVAR